MNKKTLSICIIMGITIMLLTPLKYKYLFIFYPLIFIKYNRKCFFISTVLFLLITPSFKYILEIHDTNEPMSPPSQNIIKMLKNDNLDKFINQKDSFLYSRNICYFYYNDCEKLIKSTGIRGQFDSYMSPYLFDKGNLIHVIEENRGKYRFNKYLTKIDLRNKTIFIPFSSEDIVNYNYGLLKNIAYDNILNSKDKCKLLLFGSQNKWDKYKKQLIVELQNDKTNNCIKNIEDVSVMYKEPIAEEYKNKILENNKRKLVIFLQSSY